ncbi:hypothetical protein ASPCAL01394 [Aspergillus calidoustus]|uniref:Uncharacterized protein n=1 Tax=Aspergillus calidoustus TaxID=454130 RepID=A0A0U5FUT9_ASPCI|nr:hypothetical protein ASPCAL01394 [Aspergillus calidoustus]
MLATGRETSGATATATGTEGVVSAEETGSGLDSNSGSDADSDSGSGSSKAKIAGPVVSGLAAIALIISAVWFFQRRHRQRRDAADTGVFIAELPEKGVDKGELPAREPAAVELSAAKEQNQVHELA